MVFIFIEQMCDARTTPLPIDSHAPYAKLATQRNNKTEKQACATMAESSFVWRPSSS